VRHRSLLPIWLAFALLVSPLGWAGAQEAQTIELNAPDLSRGLPVMKALSVRASATEWAEMELAAQDLSDLLWAANGVNRPESGKRTAPSAMNAQDVDIYVFLKQGAYRYDPRKHALTLVVVGDHRAEITRRPSEGPALPPAGKESGPEARPEGPTPGAGEGKAGPPPAARPSPPRSPAPVELILVSDLSRFPHGSDEHRAQVAAIDTGCVSQNISLFCAATGLSTRPRAGMNKELIRSLLQLTETQLTILNHPVGYPPGS